MVLARLAGARGCTPEYSSPAILRSPSSRDHHPSRVNTPGLS
ncbi:MAG TPA: hypothetical protein VMR00_12900 [Streptosporangiaceae bacterium]|nr:hypothetical protein [Streptosporangiaceae bacterium]